MAAILEKLGVPRDVRLFFKPYFKTAKDGSLVFPFGSEQEHFSKCFHRLPAAIHPWIAGDGPLVFISFSAMEALAFLSLHRHSYPDFKKLRFIATGTSGALPETGAQKINLLFGKDLLGRLWDIHASARLRGKHIAIRFMGNEQFRFTYSGRFAVLPVQRISLNAVEKALALRSGIRTVKPKGFNTFLEQLKKQSL